MKLLFSAFFCTLSVIICAQTPQEPVKVEIKNLGPTINSPYPDYAPLISADGNVLVFTSRKPTLERDIQKGKEGKENVYISYYDDKNSRWLVTFMLGPNINTPDIDNSAIALSNDGQRMFIYRGGNEQNSTGDILESVLVGEEWSEPVRLPFPINTDFNESSASISPDGRTIYFVSDRKWGYGGRDIWSSTQDENGTWGEAVNLGREINSIEDEEGVFIHPNGKVLFFSSRGHNTMGGYDIFMSVFDETTQSWSKAENLESPVNTKGDDIYFVMSGNGKTAYYASANPEEPNNVDIFKINFLQDIMKKNVTLLKGKVLDKAQNPIGASIILTEESTGKLIGTFKSNKTSGKYLVSLPPGKKYNFEISAAGYKKNLITVDVPYKAGYIEMETDFTLEK
jgi:hypothetical protein